jgi:hypothetical protein
LPWSALLAANTWPVRSALRQSHANPNCYFFTYSYTNAHSDSYCYSNSNGKTYTDTERYPRATTSSDSAAETQSLIPE